MPGGGLGGGGGPAPLSLGEHSMQFGPGTSESVANEDVSRALPGEVVATSKGKHEAGENYSGLQAGGAITSEGSGGEAVWTQSLDPAERALLKRYFQ